MLDFGSDLSFANDSYIQTLDVTPQPCSVQVLLANQTAVTVTSFVHLHLSLPADSLTFEAKVFVFSSTPFPLVLGRSELTQLPISVTLQGQHIFTGYRQLTPTSVEPIMSVGDGIPFITGSPEQQQAVSELIVRYKKAVFEWSGTIGLFHGQEADLPLHSDQPVSAKPYRIGIPQRKAFQTILQDYLSKGWIEPSRSRYGAPAFLVPKKAQPGSPPQYRLVEDYRALNKLMIEEPYPMPCVQDLLDRLGTTGAFFVTLDLPNGYHHVPLTVQAREKTAFVTPQGIFQYRVLPFGLKTAPRIFQRTLEHILAAHLGRRCLVYLDDIVVFGNSFETLLSNLSLVLEDLTVAGGTIRLKKCKFLAPELEYLGHVIDATGIRPSPQAVSAVKEFPLPNSLKELQRFLGLATYVRKFMPAFADMEYKLRRAYVFVQGRFQLKPEAHAIIIQIKDAISANTKLFRFDPAATTILRADASGIALGSVLLQGTDMHSLHPVEYASRALSATEQRYSNTERELLSVVWAVTKKFRPYLEGVPFKVGTDHKSLLGNIKLQPHTARTIRLLLKLEPYHYEFEHVPGLLMAAPDALSRVAMAASLATPEDRLALIRNVHVQQGHPSWKVTLHVLRQHHHWPRIRQDVWRTVIACPQCLDHNSATRQIRAPLVPIRSQKPQQILVADILGPLQPQADGSRFALLAVDHFSRFAVMIPLRHPSSAAVIQAFRDIFLQLGSFEHLVTDRGSQFTSRQFRRYVTSLPLHHHWGSPQNFHSTGACERLVRTLKTMQSKSHHLPSNDWQGVIYAYNRNPHTATQRPPIDVFFSQDSSSADASQTAQSVRHYTDGWSRRLNAHRRPFQPGDYVQHFRPLPTTLRHAVDRHLPPKTSRPLRVLQLLPFNRLLVSDGYSRSSLPAAQLRHFNPVRLGTSSRGGELYEKPSEGLLPVEAGI
jgi:transposase InsO family protein